MAVKVWIGRYESDVLTYKENLFDFSITYYGSNKKNNYAFLTPTRCIAVYDDKFVKFVNISLQKIISINSYINFEMFFYSNGIKRKFLSRYPEYKDFCKCCNEDKLIDWLNNKTYSRLWLENTVNVPKYALLSKYECTYTKLHSLFPDYNQFIVQKNYSSGGHGTYRLNIDNQYDIQNKLSYFEPYLVSPFYREALSMCCHVVISEDIYLIFPLGLQLLSEANNRMSYEGTDYSYFKSLDNVSKANCTEFISKVSNMLSKNGYRGICGYDFLLIDKKPVLIEINPRYMGSSYLINHVLSENNLPSLFELNIMAFENSDELRKYIKQISSLNINYVTRTVSNFSEKKNVRIPNKKWLFTDGLTENTHIKQDVYLYRFFERK